MLDKIRALYPPDLWAAFLGQLVVALGLYMFFPFLTVYLNIHLHIPLMTTMVVVSVAPVTGFLSLLAVGRLADRWGRKPVLILSLLGMAAALTLYGLARTAWEFAAVTAVDGMFGALYRPTLNAWVSDTVAEDRRTEVFSFLRVGLNAGAAVGPAIGSFLLLTRPALLFVVATVCVALTAALLWVFLPESRPSGRKPSRVEPSDPAGGTVPLRNRPSGLSAIVALTVFNLPVAIFYDQLMTNFPIYLSHHFADYTQMIAMLYLFGAFIVVFLQIGISRVLRRVAAWITIAVSFLAFAVAGFGYAWASSLGVLLGSEFIFAIGEMVGLPQLSQIVSLLAPPDKRGLCFSIFDTRWRLGEILGPLWGGWLMTAVGGANSFRIAGLLVLASGIGTVALVAGQPGKESPAAGKA